MFGIENVFTFVLIFFFFFYIWIGNESAISTDLVRIHQWGQVGCRATIGFLLCGQSPIRTLVSLREVPWTIFDTYFGQSMRSTMDNLRKSFAFLMYH